MSVSNSPNYLNHTSIPDRTITDTPNVYISLDPNISLEPRQINITLLFMRKFKKYLNSFSTIDLKFQAIKDRKLIYTEYFNKVIKRCPTIDSKFQAMEIYKQVQVKSSASAQNKELDNYPTIDLKFQAVYRQHKTELAFNQEAEEPQTAYSSLNLRFRQAEARTVHFQAPTSSEESFDDFSYESVSEEEPRSFKRKYRFSSNESSPKRQRVEPQPKYKDCDAYESIKYYRDGKILKCNVFKNNERFGQAKIRYPDGEVTRFSYEDGQGEGDATTTWPDGSTESFFLFNNLPQGEAIHITSEGYETKYWYINGKIEFLEQNSRVEEIPNEAEKLFGHEEQIDNYRRIKYFSNGTVLKYLLINNIAQGPAFITNADGTKESLYFQNGECKKNFSYKEYFNDNKIEEYFDDGRVLSYTIINGKPEGKALNKWPGGKEEHFSFFNGQREGKAIYIDSQNVKIEYIYINDELEFFEEEPPVALSPFYESEDFPQRLREKEVSDWEIEIEENVLNFPPDLKEPDFVIDRPVSFLSTESSAENSAATTEEFQDESTLPIALYHLILQIKDTLENETLLLPIEEDINSLHHVLEHEKIVFQGTKELLTFSFLQLALEKPSDEKKPFFDKALKWASGKEELEILVRTEMVTYFEKEGLYSDVLCELQKISQFPSAYYTFNRIGLIYTTGLGDISKDLKKAAEYFKKGADSGDQIAENNLALTFDNLRREAFNCEDRERYRLEALRLYSKFKILKSTSNHPTTLQADFSYLFLSCLDKDGCFSPGDLKEVQEYLGTIQSTYETSSIVPLMQALTTSIQKKRKNQKIKQIKGYLKEAVKKNSAIARSLIRLDDDAMLEKLQYYIKNPEPIYLEL